MQNLYFNTKNWAHLPKHNALVVFTVQTYAMFKVDIYIYISYNNIPHMK